MEIWKEIDSETFIEFSYEVSNLGNVRSLNYNRTGKTQNLKVRFSPTDRRVVVLAGRKAFSVAQLVLTAFVEPKPSEKYFAFHKSGDFRDDSLENLEWRLKSVQNKLNGKTGHKFKKGHTYGVGSRFKSGNMIGAAHRFKKQTAS